MNNWDMVEIGERERERYQGEMRDEVRGKRENFVIAERRKVW